MNSFEYKTAFELYLKIGDSDLRKKILLDLGETVANTIFLRKFWAEHSDKLRENFGMAETSDFAKYLNFPQEIRAYIDKKTRLISSARAIHQNLEFYATDAERAEKFAEMLAQKNEAKKLIFLIQYFEETGKIAPEFVEKEPEEVEVFTEDIAVLLRRKSTLNRKLSSSYLKKYPKTEKQINAFKKEYQNIENQLNRLL